MNQQQFPPACDATCEYDAHTQPSARVLVRPANLSGLWFGQYMHGLKKWRLDGVPSAIGIQVVEWWPLPDAGTGNNVEEAK